MRVHLFLASRRYRLKSCGVAGGYRRQLCFFDLCQLEVLLLVKVDFFFFFFSHLISRVHGVVGRPCMVL